MGHRLGTWPTALVALGVGLGVGAYLGRFAVLAAVIAIPLGVALFFVDKTPEPELTAAQPPFGKEPGPALGQLGTRVEQILRLAEQQAADQRAEAAAEAKRIVSEARVRADAMADDAGDADDVAASAETAGTETAEDWSAEAATSEDWSAEAATSEDWTSGAESAERHPTGRPDTDRF